ncbi:DoxX family protein [Aggregicoccus sp. 17bor-14]|uniref:DoxX family protein n=1 Tax=Myxococcaceae TaxID=31 RepID=UPI00129CF3E4|nr:MULTISPECIES: DoxX family protein [Myxococcaceae]MBF5045925.1 DoxX family protein [Simulacricoccus sp. 17bor-14]MRI91659.1 DoxX family protein [Aggregicoccus sp. 17bor-14]
MGILAPIGRFLFSVMFLVSGMNHFMNYPAMVGYARASGVPSPDTAVLVSGVVLVVGGLCVLLGAFARLGALLLAGFLLASAVLVHHFWKVADPAQAQDQMVHFFKNLSMAGGALLIAHFGPGPYSLGRRAERFASRIQIPLNRRG